MSVRSNLPFPQPIKFSWNAGKVLSLVVFLLLAIGVFSSFYQVPTNSVAIVQRFGKYLDTKPSGLHFKLPWGIDMVTYQETKRQLKLEFGYGTLGGTNEYQYNQDDDDRELEKNMVTGDLNAAVVEWVVQFHIADARAYTFNVLEPQATLRDVAESVMREVVGDRSIDEVLTVGRQEMEVKALERMQEIARHLDMGVLIDQVQLGNVNPPAEVKDSFDEVNRAQQQREAAINNANGEYNRVIPEARGKAEQSVSQAEGYATERVNRAEGDANRFTALLTEYQKAPDVTRKRIYLETLTELLPTLPGMTVVDERLSQLLPVLQMQKSSAGRGKEASPKSAPATQTPSRSFTR